MAIEKKVLFEVNGFTVREDSVYLIKDKKDGDAPSGFVEEGISKLPGVGINDSFQIPFHMTGEGTGVWDTGFYVYSPCYAGVDVGEQKLIVENLVKNVVKPYRNYISDGDIFSKGGSEDFTNLNFSIHSGKIYMTSKPEQVLELYFALRSNIVAPKGEEGNAVYNGTHFVVVDSTKSTTVKNENTLNFFKAASMFSTLYNSDKDGLHNLLFWIGVPNVSATADEAVLSSVFAEYSKSRPDIIKSFLDGAVDLNNEFFKAKIKVYKKLKQYKGSRLQKLSNGIYYFDDMEIGADYKGAAENIIKNRELVAIKDEFLDIKISKIKKAE